MTEMIVCLRYSYNLGGKIYTLHANPAGGLVATMTESTWLG